MLRIGELARLAGTTVRTVRHYHAEGLLDEPPRDSSGYRRYGAADLIRLLRIRRLRELGLPLDRARAPESADLHSLLASLERELDEQQRRIDERRRRIADLRRSIDPELPAEIAEYFGAVAAAGIDPELLRREKEMVLLMLALAPETAARLAGVYARMRQDPAKLAAMVEVMRRIGDLDGGFVAPAEVQRLAADVAELSAEWMTEGGDADAADGTDRVLADHLRSYPRAQRRLIELVMAENRGLP